MKHYLIGFLTVMVSLFTFVPQASAKVMWQEKGTLTIPAGETIDDDLFIAGENVNIDGIVTGDVYVGAGAVKVDGIIKGSLFVGTGDLNLASATIGNSLIVGAGNVLIDKDSKIGGSLLAAAGNLKNYAPVGRNLMAGAGNFYLDSKVGKEVRVGSGNIELGPHTNISGNFTYALGKEGETFGQDPAATIGGTVTKYTPPVQAQRDLERAKSDFTKFSRAFHGGWLVISFLGSLLVGFLLLRLFPKTSLGLANQITWSPMLSLGTGFLIVIAAFPVLLVLALTVIGLPLAGLLFLLFCLELHLAKLAAAYALGRFVAGQFSWNKMGVYAVFFVGLAIFYLLRAIPMIGWVASALFTWVGLGAMWHYAHANQKNL